MVEKKAVIFTCANGQKTEQHYINDRSIIAGLEDDFSNNDIKEKLSIDGFELYSKYIGMRVKEGLDLSSLKGFEGWETEEKLLNIKIYFDNKELFKGKGRICERYRNIYFESEVENCIKADTFYFNKNMWKKLTIVAKG